MKHEDPALHQCPEPWVSEQVDINKGAFPVFIITFGVGLFTFLWEWFDPSDLWTRRIPTFMMAGFFMGIGLVILYGTIKSNLDKKDHWKVKLPYNKELFEKIDCFPDQLVVCVFFV